jgi:RNA polymerase sigma-70 factor, ECF subfamily
MLIVRVAAGCETALISLYAKRQSDVYRFAYAMSRSRAIAEDATQDAFLSVIEHATRFDPLKGSALAWLIGCARHRVLDRLRTESRVIDVYDEPYIEDAAANIDSTRLSRLLHQAISRLPIPYREAVVLCDLQEMTYADAASVLECPIGTVRSRLARGRRQLLRMLTDQHTNLSPLTDWHTGAIRP